MVLNSLNFYLSEKLLIPPSILNEILARYSNLGCRFFPFRTLNISCHSFCPAEILLKDQLLSICSFPCIFLAAFNILSLCLVFVSFISMCLGMFLLVFNLYDILCDSWTWLTISFSMLGKFSTTISSKFFSYPFFFSSSSGTLIFQTLVHLMLSWWSWDCPQFFSFFLLYFALQKLFPPFYLPGHWFVLLLQIFCYQFLLEYF